MLEAKLNPILRNLIPNKASKMPQKRSKENMFIKKKFPNTAKSKKVQSFISESSKVKGTYWIYWTNNLFS